MNKIFKIIWSVAHGDWVVASEDARATKGSRSSLTNARTAGLRLSGIAVALLAAMGLAERAQAQGNPAYDDGVVSFSADYNTGVNPWNVTGWVVNNQGPNVKFTGFVVDGFPLTGPGGPLNLVFDNQGPLPSYANKDYTIAIDIKNHSNLGDIDLSNYTILNDLNGAGGNSISISDSQVGSIFGPNSSLNTTYTVGGGASIGGNISAGTGASSNTFNFNGGYVNGNVTGGTQDDTFNLSGTQFNNSTLATGAGANTVNINGAAGAPLSGLTSIDGSAGSSNILHLNTVTLTKAAADAFTHANGSTDIIGFDTVYVDEGGVLKFDSGSDSYTLSQLNIGAGGELTSSGVNTINGAVANWGIIDLRSPGGAGNTLQINGNYDGGGELQLNTNLDTGVSDKLVIENGTVTGTTRLNITATGQGNASEAGITVVDLQGTSTAANNAFVLNNGTSLQSAGLYTYELTRQDLTQNSSDFILVSAGLAPRVPVYSLSAAAAQSLALSNVGSMRDRGGAYEASARTSVHDLTKTMDGKYWTRIRYDRIDMKRGDSSLDQKEFLFQLGYNLIENYGEANDGTLTRRGFTVGYGDAAGDVDGRDYSSDTFRYSGVGKVDTQSYSLGAYQTNFWGNGIYLDLVGQVSLLDSKLRDVEQHRARTQGWNAYLSTELGQTIPFGKGDWRIEPQVQVTLSRTEMDKFDDGEVYVDDVSQNLVRARAGAWLFNNFQTNSGNNTMFYTLLNVWHDVTKPDKIKLSDTADAIQLRPEVVRTWAELGVGFQQTLANNRITLFGDIRGQHALSNGDRDGYGAQIGIKANW